MKLVLFFLAIFTLGALNVLSFSPYHLWHIPWVTLLVVIVAMGKRPQHTPLILFSFHLGLFCAGLHWICVSMTEFGGLSHPVAWFLIAGLSTYLAAIYGLMGWLWVKSARYVPASVAWIFLLPAFWLCADWLRGYLFTGFPWLWFGYGQIDSPLVALAPVLGVQGLTLTLLWTVIALKLYLGDGVRHRHVYLPPAICWVVALLLYPFDFVVPKAPVQAALIQANIKQSLKWQPEYLVPTLNTYAELTQKVSPQTRIIVWPESALPEFEHEIYPFLHFFHDTLVKKQQSLVAGLLVHEQSKDAYYNGILVVGHVPQGVDSYRLGHNNRYYKEHLLPIGEFVPFETFLRGLAPFFDLPMSSFHPGVAQAPNLNVADMQAAPAICYEIAFSEKLRQKLRPETSLILTVSNDSWFGHSIGPWQHAEMARMRALEFGRPVLRATNTGVTQMIDHHGQVTAELPQFKSAILEAKFSPTQGRTPYFIWGSWPLILGVLFVFLGCLYHVFVVRRG